MSAQQSTVRVAKHLADANDQVVLAVEADTADLAGPYMRGAIGHLLAAVTIQAEQIATLEASVRAAHDHAQALDARTFGSMRIGGQS